MNTETESVWWLPRAFAVVLVVLCLPVSWFWTVAGNNCDKPDCGWMATDATLTIVGSGPLVLLFLVIVEAAIAWARHAR
ncbi:MAG: hypothetical protein JHC95_08150 [Solirubrobacteraceae bacterium]|nr:hypothetical protein [Solirubrobacteraceae bacterium]